MPSPLSFGDQVQQLILAPAGRLARGFVHDPNTFADVVPQIEKALAKAAAEGIGDQHQLEQLVHRTVSRWTYRKYRRNPVIIPIVIDA